MRLRGDLFVDVVGELDGGHVGLAGLKIDPTLRLLFLLYPLQRQLSNLFFLAVALSDHR